jgi:outer membrane protein assembly factor BamE (lipoprotein component of BamABCDE complex)
MTRALIKLACLTALAGCASYDGSSLRPGASTADDARSVMGRPALELADQDGGRHLVYPHGPLGTQTYVVDVDANSRVKQVRQALTDDTFNAVRPGLTRDDILRLIGPPGEEMTFARSGQTAWDYRYQDTWGYRAIFSVMFDANGIVVSKFARRIERSPGRD